MALTKREIDRLTYDPAGPKRQVAYDKGKDGVPGFGVAVTPTGVKTFILQYRPAGSAIPRRLTIGRYGALTLAQAREEAKKALYNAKYGKDPVEAKQEARRGETVRDLVKQYRTREMAHLKSADQIERRLEGRILPALGHKRVRDVTTADVERLHHDIGESAPYEANRVRSTLHRLFECARKWGYTDRREPNPVADVEPFDEKSRDRFADATELPLVWRAIEAEEDVHVRVALKLILLTGCRKQEIMTRRWTDIDLTGATLHLPDTKAGEPQTVPLSTEAVALLREIPRGFGDTPVFPRATIDKAWNRVRARLWLATHPDEAAKLRNQAERDVQRYRKHSRRDEVAIEARLLKLALPLAKAGKDRFTLHDLRRSVGSLMALSEAPTVVGKVLRNPSAVEVYMRIKDNEARRALEDHGARITAIVKQGGST